MAMNLPGSSAQPPAFGHACVSAVILSHNSISTLPRVLSAVRNQIYGVSRVIIVDNGSTDGTQRYCEDACRDCTLLRRPTQRGVVHRAQGFRVCEAAPSQRIRHRKGFFSGGLLQSLQAAQTDQYFGTHLLGGSLEPKTYSFLPALGPSTTRMKTESSNRRTTTRS